MSIFFENEKSKPLPGGGGGPKLGLGAEMLLINCDIKSMTKLDRLLHKLVHIIFILTALPVEDGRGVLEGIDQ